MIVSLFLWRGLTYIIVMGLPTALKPGLWSLNKTTHTSWPINVNIPDSINTDITGSRSYPLCVLESGNDRLISRCSKTNFRTRSPVTMVFTVRESEKEATPIGKNQVGGLTFWRSFLKRLNCTTKVNDVAAWPIEMVADNQSRETCLMKSRLPEKGGLLTIIGDSTWPSSDRSWYR